MLFGLLAAGWGAKLFEDVSDVWSTLLRLLLTGAATSALMWELVVQARRVDDSATRWGGTDTTNTAVLGLYAALLAIAALLPHAPRHEKASAAIFATLYVGLGCYFVCRRLQAMTGRCP